MAEGVVDGCVSATLAVDAPATMLCIARTRTFFASLAHAAAPDLRPSILWAMRATEKTELVPPAGAEPCSSVAASASALPPKLLVVALVAVRCVGCSRACKGVAACVPLLRTRPVAWL